MFGNGKYSRCSAPPPNLPTCWRRRRTTTPADLRGRPSTTARSPNPQRPDEVTVGRCRRRPRSLRSSGTGHSSVRPDRRKEVSVPYSKSEAKPDCRIDCVAIEVAVRQSIIDLREHEPGVSIKLLSKLPIDNERNGNPRHRHRSRFSHR
jgi:hypothetical protein